MGLDPARRSTAPDGASGPGAFTLTLRGDFRAVSATLDGHPYR